MPRIRVHLALKYFDDWNKSDQQLLEVLVKHASNT